MYFSGMLVTKKGERRKAPDLLKFLLRKETVSSFHKTVSQVVRLLSFKVRPNLKRGYGLSRQVKHACWDVSE